MPDDAMNEQDSTGAATEPREPEAQDSTESPLDALRKEKDALQDRLLRTAADLLHGSKNPRALIYIGSGMNIGGSVD